MEQLAGLAAAFAPEPVRRDLVSRYGVDPAAWSCLVGFVELFGGALWLVDDFLVRIHGIVDQQTDAILAHAETSRLGDEAALAATWSGAYAWFLWAISPTTLLVGHLTVVGLLRLVAFATAREPVTEPLVWLGWRLWRSFVVAPAQAAAETRRFGTARPDLVLEPEDGTLVVLTARPRPDWNELVTIEVRERFYRLVDVGERMEKGRRWYAHTLEEQPESAVCRGLVRYEPPST
jgi:hypothetical protein